MKRKKAPRVKVEWRLIPPAEHPEAVPMAYMDDGLLELYWAHPDTGDWLEDIPWPFHEKYIDGWDPLTKLGFEDPDEYEFGS